MSEIISLCDCFDLLLALTSEKATMTRINLKLSVGLYKNDAFR